MLGGNWNKTHNYFCKPFFWNNSTWDSSTLEVFVVKNIATSSTTSSNSAFSPTPMATNVVQIGGLRTSKRNTLSTTVPSFLVKIFRGVCISTSTTNFLSRWHQNPLFYRSYPFPTNSFVGSRISDPMCNPGHLEKETTTDLLPKGRQPYPAGFQRVEPVMVFLIAIPFRKKKWWKMKHLWHMDTPNFANNRT